MRAARGRKNPLLERLKRGAGHAAGWPGLVVAAALCGWVWYVYWRAVAGSGSSMMGLVGLGLGFSSVVALLLFLAWLAANFPVTYMRSGEYELVCATPLTDADWVAAYVDAVFYRSRALILTALALTPLLTAGFPVLPWPATHVFGQPVTSDLLLRYGYYTIILLVAEMGLYRWVVSLGVALAMWWRTPVPAALGALALPVGAWVATAAGLEHLVAGLGPEAQLAGELVWTAAVALAPYGLAALTERWGWRFGHGPTIGQK